MADVQSVLLADVAIDDPGQDRLGRAPFAKSLANSLLNLQGKDSFVFGLCGPWGSGKTSVLNLAIKELETAAKSKPPIVIRFNPWWFSGRHQLLETFLRQFGAAISGQEQGKFARDVGHWFNELSTTLRPLSLVPGVGKVAQVAKDIAEVAEMYAKTDVHQVRANISQALLGLDCRIVVVMDDIDRLSADEIAEVFLILKAVGDFPNTVYLLAFDSRVVRRAIRKKLGVNGKTYLEKIVQLQLELPTVGHTAVHRLFLEQISELLGSAEMPESIQRDLGNLFHDGIKHYLTTPRASKRLLNTLRFSFPSLKDEVYFPDFVGVSALFTFCPTVARLIANNAEEFTGIGAAWQDGDASKAFHKSWLESVTTKDRPYVKGIVTRLFPRCAGALGGSGYSPSFETRWSRQRRVCSSSRFEAYFLLALPTGAISESEWSSILESIPFPEKFEAHLMRLADKPGRDPAVTRLKEALDRLEELARESTDETKAKALFNSIISLGDKLILIRDEEVLGGMLPWNNETRVVRILLRSLEHLKDPKQRLALVLDSLNGDCGLFALSELVDSLGRQHGEFGSDKLDGGPDEPLIPRDSLPLVLRRVARKIGDAANGDETSGLANNPFCLRIVRNWMRFGSEQTALKWFRRQAKRDEFLIAQLRQATNKIRSHGFSDQVATETPFVDTKFLGNFFDLKQLKRRCARLFERQLSDEDGPVVKMTFDNIKDDGSPVTP